MALESRKLEGNTSFTNACKCYLSGACVFVNIADLNVSFNCIAEAKEEKKTTSFDQNDNTRQCLVFTHRADAMSGFFDA